LNRMNFFRETWIFSRNRVKIYRFNWRNTKKNNKVLTIYNKISGILINKNNKNYN
jgi:hypothetical protein